MFRHIALLLAFSIGMQAQAYDFAAIAEQHVLPAYRQLAQSAAELDTETRAYCNDRTQPGLERLQGSHIRAFLAWQGAQHLRFGPVQFLSREYRFALWPDKRGTVGRHLRRLLDDPALQANAFDISRKSIAVQGFSALERLLFADAAPDAKACLVITAIGANLHTMAEAIVEDWSAGNDPYIAYFSQPGPDNELYESAAEIAGQLLNSLHTELELVVTQKLARPLGGSLATARGKRAEAWRSRSALAAIQANVTACRQLYRHAFSAELQGGLEEEETHRRIETAFDQAQALLARITMPLSQAVADPGPRAQVERLHAALSRLAQLVARDLTRVLDLSLGFNSLDGD